MQPRRYCIAQGAARFYVVALRGRGEPNSPIRLRRQGRRLDPLVVHAPPDRISPGLPVRVPRHNQLGQTPCGSAHAPLCVLAATLQLAQEIEQKTASREDFNMTVLRQHNRLTTVLVAISAILFAYDMVPFLVPTVALMVTSVTVLRLAYGGGHSFGINPDSYFYTVQSEEYKREVIAFMSILFVALGSNIGPTLFSVLRPLFDDCLQKTLLGVLVCP
jgi:hypothetical protein